MRTAKGTGRLVGVLLLLQLAAALMLPFILIRALMQGSPGFLTAAAENSLQIRASLLISCVGALLTVGLGITAMPVFQKYSRAAALWFFALCLISCTLDLAHSGAVMSMLSLSQQYTSAGVSAAADPGPYNVVGGAVAAARRWAHCSQLVAIAAWILFFYGTLFRYALVPRVLAAAGLLAGALQFTGVTLMMILGYNVIGELAMPLLPVQIIAAVWLMARGFGEGLPSPTSGSVFAAPGEKITV